MIIRTNQKSLFVDVNTNLFHTVFFFFLIFPQLRILNQVRHRWGNFASRFFRIKMSLHPPHPGINRSQCKHFGQGCLVQFSNFHCEGEESTPGSHTHTRTNIHKCRPQLVTTDEQNLSTQPPRFQSCVSAWIINTVCSTHDDDDARQKKESIILINFHFLRMLILEWAKCVSCLSNCFKAKVGENKDGCGQAANTFVSPVAASCCVACAAFKVKLAPPPPTRSTFICFAGMQERQTCWYPVEVICN